MSTALAIASVTQVLKDLLNNGLIDHDITDATGGNVTVTSLPPDKIDTSSSEQTQLNLFMYHVTPNAGWRNVGYPSLNSNGDRVTNPPLAVDLHYLLTAYGSNDLHTEILLGYGMQLFHENPVLVRDAIRRSLALPSLFTGDGLPTNLEALSTSKLADQVEQIKLTPEIMNAEELSKLWTAFQAKYRPTAAYMATVVLIESTKSTKSALPVKARNIYVVPFKQPVIQKIRSKANAAAPVMDSQKILQNYFLVLGGYNLKADNLNIDLDGIAITPAPGDITDTQIIFQLPTDFPAGIHGVQVISRINMGTPEVLHRGTESNIEAFVLNPTINTVNITDVSGSGASPRSGNINLNIKPAVGDQQRILLLLNEINNAPDTLPKAYSFSTSIPLSPPGPTEDITISATGVKAGTYLVRVQIDGAESPLGTDVNGKYDSPSLIIA